jgi:hypothetical protein
MEAKVFDAAGMAVKIIKENTGATRENLQNSLLSTKGYPGDIGRISFTAAGDADKEAFIPAVRDGKIVQVR